MVTQKISCPLCGSIHTDLVFRAKDFRFKISSEEFSIFSCSRCKLRFLSPLPDRSKIALFYPLGFNKNDQGILYKIIRSIFNIGQERAVKSIFKKYNNSGKTLDIGCGNGTLMNVLQKNGYDVWGVEVNLDAEKYSYPSLRGRIFYNELAECGFQEKSFDIITCFQVLEHIIYPGSVLEEIRRILKDDGILYLSVPNAAFFESYLFGRYCYNLEVPRHLYFFTIESLRNLLEKKGVQIERLLPKSILEIILTPASFYHSIWYFLEDRLGFSNRVVKYLTFVPLVIVRFFSIIIFIFERQNLEVICRVKNNKKVY